MADFRRYSAYSSLFLSVYRALSPIDGCNGCCLLTILKQYEQFYRQISVYDNLEGVNKCPFIKLSCSSVDDLHKGIAVLACSKKLVSI
jgi:hypothetical protein